MQKSKGISNENYLKKLGEKIQSLRFAQGLSQEQLAEKLGTGHTQISRVERGEVNSTINMLRKIAFELDITIGELVDIK